MNDNIKKMVQERLGLVPKSIQSVLLRPSFSSAVRIVAQKHNLPEERITQLENEVVLVLLAFESDKELAQNITTELLIPAPTAESIAHDIDEMIFSEVRDDLFDIQKKRERDEPYDMGKIDAEEIPEEYSSEIQQTQEGVEQESVDKTYDENVQSGVNPKMRLQRLSSQYAPQTEMAHDSEPEPQPAATHEHQERKPEQPQQTVRGPENRWPKTIHQEHADEVKETLHSMQKGSREQSEHDGASSVPNYSKPFTDTPKRPDTYQGKDPYHEPIE